MPTLLTQFYKSPNEARNRELELCFRENLKNKAITRFVWFVPESDRQHIPDWLQGEIIVTKDRLVYSDAFQASRPGDLHILCNSDIIIGEEAVQLIEANLKDDQAYCLSRWDCDPLDELNLSKAKLETYFRSQDSWCWRGLINCAGDVPLGVSGCDNRIAYELSRVRRVSNPARTIKTLHVHTSNFRTYRHDVGKIPPPHLGIPPTTL